MNTLDVYEINFTTDNTAGMLKCIVLATSDVAALEYAILEKSFQTSVIRIYAYPSEWERKIYFEPKQFSLFVCGEATAYVFKINKPGAIMSEDLFEN